MDMTVDKTVFLKALSHAQKAVEKRNTIPILGNVKLSAETGSLTLTATDMEISVTETITTQVQSPGSITVPAVMLYQIVSKLPDGSEVHLQTSDDNQVLDLTSGQAKFSLQLLPADEFPEIGEDEELPIKFSLAKDVLEKLLNKTHFAMSSEETRYYLNGIYLHTKADDDGMKKLLAVATDGHRLAKVDSEAPEGCECPDGIIVPRKAIMELKDFIGEADGAIDVALSDSKIRFTIGNLILLSKLVDGTFPDYERVIPSENKLVMRLSCGDFKKAVDRVAIISSERLRGVKLILKEKSLQISAVNPAHGSAEETLPVEYSGDELEIGFNAQYLMDIASQVTEGRLEVAFADSSAPALMSDSDDENIVFVLMPMRV